MTDVTWQAFIDWDNDGNFTGTYDDVSSDLLDVSIAGGRNRGTDQFAAGSCAITLENSDGKYSRYNASSPIFGLMLPGRPFKLQAVHGSTVQQFRGTLTESRETISTRGIPAVQMTFLDGFEQLRKGSIRTALLENQRVDEVLTAIADAAGWSATRRDFDTARATLGRYYGQRAKPLDALQDAAKNELGGALYMSRPGNLRFENRDFRTLAPVYATISDADQLQLQLRQTDLIDEVQLRGSGLVEDDAPSVLYSLSPGGYRLDPGNSSPRNRISAAFANAAKDVITPTVNSSTAYDAAVLADAPVAFWKLSENAGAPIASDSSGNGYDGAFVNAPTLEAPTQLVGQGGSGVRLNGVDQYVEVPFDAALNPSTVFSLEAFGRITGGEGTQRQLVVSVHNTGPTDVKGFFLECYSTDTWNAVVLSGSAFNFIQGPKAVLNEGTHLVMTYDGGTLRLYVNGEPAGAVAAAYVPNPDTLLRIGAGTPSPVVPFLGDIERVAIYNTLLSPTRVKAHYDAAKTVDFTANSAADGSGSDRTAQVAIDSFTAYGGGFDLVFNNLDSSPVYLVGSPALQVRGTAVRRDNSERLVDVAVSAPLVTGQLFSDSLDWTDDPAYIEARANVLAATLGTDQPRPIVQLLAHTDAEIDVVLGVDVSKRVTLDLTGGLYPAYLSGDYFVESYKVDAVIDQDIKCSLLLWPADQAGGNFFRISGASGGGQDYSEIVDAGATSGDRIAV